MSVEWFAFVSADGRVAGVVRGRERSLSTLGVALAYLDTPCDLKQWRQALFEENTAEEAADRLVTAYGGHRIQKTVPLMSPAWFLTLPIVGEA
jgi:hypothetical protein